MKSHQTLKHVLTLVLGATTVVSMARAENGAGNSVVNANPRVGVQPNVIAKGNRLVQIAEGLEPLENPSGVITKFGLLSTGVRTEPDENTYVVFEKNPGGPDANFDYGRHFLYQGHENAGNLAYVTRINLDITEAAHRITLLTPVGANGLTGLNAIDGSTWNPFTRTLLFTQENGAAGGLIQITASWPPVVTRLDGIVGQAGYEGVHVDDHGNIILIEDVGGTSVNVSQGDATSPKTARQPNSFVYRFVPADITDLSKGGKLQALQVTIDGHQVVFGADPVADVFSADQLKLHSLGSSWPVKWITLHDTAVNGTATFDANKTAKLAGATPFKRPENMAFVPRTGFNSFFFVTTGDTDLTSGSQPALQARGAFGSLFRVDLSDSRNDGNISIFFRGDAAHNSFDNLTFRDDRTLAAAEDRGDTLHLQLNALDSIWTFDMKHAKDTPVRLLALGRDAVSTAEVQATGAEDNEPTGLHTSDGSSAIGGLLYTRVREKARTFFTQQHGQNTVFEVVKEGRD